MHNLTRPPGAVKPRSPDWRSRVRRSFPLPRRAAWSLTALLLAATVLVDLAVRSLS